MLAATNISENTQFAKFAKYNSTPKFVDLQYTNVQLNALSQQVLHGSVSAKHKIGVKLVLSL